MSADGDAKSPLFAGFAVSIAVDRGLPAFHGTEHLC